MADRERRTHTVKIRLTDDELAALRARCPSRSLAPWLREIGLGERPVRRPPPADPALLRQLAGAGNLLNQIARAMNSAMNSGEWRAGDALLILNALDRVEVALYAAAEVED